MTTKGRKKSRHLALLLIKEVYKRPQDALKDSHALDRYSLKKSVPFNGILFVRPTRSKPPPWLTFLQSAVNRKIELQDNCSTSAVLFVSASSRIFAFTFGHGRYMLRQDSFERDFGLKVALNTLDPARLRSIDIRTFQELPLHTRQQASASSSLDVFELDVDSDLLRAVTGEPEQEDFALRVTGSDSLIINARVGISEIGNTCEQIIHAYYSTRYRKNFAWVDHLQAVREPLIVQQLDERLWDTVSSRQTEDVHLAPPEPLDWEVVDGFLYHTEDVSEEPHPDLSINDYLSTIDSHDGATVDMLKNHRIRVLFTEKDEPSPKWSVYDCLVFQAEHRGYLYVLTGGRWFQIDKKYARRILRGVKNIPMKDGFLLDARPGEVEGEYNKRVAESVRGLVLMDKKSILCDGASTPVEFCDLFSRSKQLIHVKRKTQSATLSHLFAQGVISGELFLRDDTFRDQARNILANQTPDLTHLIPKARPKTSNYEVVYAIVTNGRRKWPDSLPFFSQLFLRQNANRLMDLGYKVSIARIKLGE